MCAESLRRRSSNLQTGYWTFIFYLFFLPQSAFKTFFFFPVGCKKEIIIKKRPSDVKHLKLRIYENLHPDVSTSQSALRREKPRTQERRRRPLQSPLGPQVSMGRTQSEEQMKVGVSNHGFDVRAPPLLDCQPADWVSHLGSREGSHRPSSILVALPSGSGASQAA